MENIKVLLFDEDEIYRSHLLNFLKLNRYQVEIVDDSRTLQEELKSRKYHLAFFKNSLPDKSGVTVLKNAAILPSETRCFLIIKDSEKNLKEDLINNGAYKLINSPYQIEEIKSDILRAAEEINLKNTDKGNKSNSVFKHFVGEHSSIKKIFNIIERVANTDSTILIMGESGTGKELVAKALHNLSSRKDNYFIPVNCGAIPENLIESELFGHVKGAFTGAAFARDGRFLQANKGTIFLDEIGEMNLNMQVKILRVLQERQFEPVGGSSSVSVDVRVVAATNRDLELLVEEKKFRSDLFYRLNVVPLVLPPLRERISDLALLVEFFIKKLNDSKKTKIIGFEEKVLDIFKNYTWPGNIRELENLLERIAIMKVDGKIKEEDVPDKIKFPAVSKTTLFDAQLPEEGLDLNKALEDFENKIIMQALEKTGGNKQKAANLLRLNRTTLVEKLRKKKML